MTLFQLFGRLNGRIVGAKGKKMSIRISIKPLEQQLKMNCMSALGCYAELYITAKSGLRVKFFSFAFLISRTGYLDILE